MVTFIIIAFNEESNIKDCIYSIIDQNCQAKKRILVVNDASTDKTKKIVLKLIKKNSNIELINNPKNLGRGASRKIGVLKSHSKYIAFTDADVILPPHWLYQCILEIQKYDAVGGIAIPDGDAQYIYKKFSFTPKIVPHTTEISGGNGLFKRNIFSIINYDDLLTEGEDVDLIWKLKKMNRRLKCINDLVCRHKENKSLVQSFSWFFHSGLGSTKLFMKHHIIRTPDLVFLVFILTSVLSLFFYVQIKNYTLLYLPILYLYCISVGHIIKKFRINFDLNFFYATLLNTFLIASYMIGRLWGLKHFDINS